MVAAAPNAGKSMFALIYAIKANVPTLFFSADTDIATVMMRTAAHISGHNQTLVEENLNKNSSNKILSLKVLRIYSGSLIHHHH